MKTFSSRLIAGLSLWVVMGWTSVSAQPLSVPSHDRSASLLREKYASLSQALATNAFSRPLSLDSVQTNARVTGNAYAVIDAPFALVSSIKNPQHLCDLIILHINTKYCRPTQATIPSVLMVNFGKKTAQPIGETFALEFVMTTNSASPNYLQVSLNAERGPLGTSNYGIEVAAIPLSEGKTFLHLRYSYGFGLAGRMAMQAYLTTAGSSKVGFTQVVDTDQGTGSAKVFVGGMRGAVERNTMRYYLAIEAYLQTLGAPQAEQQKRRLEKWFDSTEQYPLQLRETDKASYMAMKKEEITRQQSGLPGS